jgi:hypothetical protein
LALLDVQLEPLATKSHRVDPNVEQYLRPGVRAKGNGVAGSGYRNQLAVARRVQGASGRIDRQSITEHAPGEDSIWRLLERGAPTCQGCN